MRLCEIWPQLFKIELARIVDKANLLPPHRHLTRALAFEPLADHVAGCCLCLQRGILGTRVRYVGLNPRSGRFLLAL